MNECEETGGRVPGILIMTHGQAGEELIRSAEMILGPLAGVYGLSLMPGMAPEEFMISVAAMLKSMPAGSLVISDLFGGTPANVSAAISQSMNISAVAGLNLSMLIEAVSSRSTLSGERLAEAAVAAGRNGCRNILLALSQAE
ncbi:MAG: PTS fructose transporter subunit IIA [Negativicutes bacterium]|nr:PTS fructose transporter subunit IIA [Negativicutes bacterium]